MKSQAAAFAYIEWLNGLVHDCELPGSLRSRIAASCFGIALDHHHAIVVLIEGRRYASSFALVRCALEAYVRGSWLLLIASDKEVEKFSEGWEPPSFGCMLNKLDSIPTFPSEKISQIKAKSWGVMCGYTHTGGLHVQRWVNKDSIEPNYLAEEINEVLLFAETIGSLSIIGIANLARNDRISEVVLAKFVKKNCSEGKKF